MKTPDPLAEALAFFDRAEAARPLPLQRPGEGFFTALELAEKKGVCQKTMKGRLDRLVAEGFAEVRAGRIKNVNANYYRIFSKKQTVSGRCICLKRVAKGCVYCPECQP